jgi:hypothetical protein
MSLYIEIAFFEDFISFSILFALLFLWLLQQFLQISILLCHSFILIIQKCIHSILQQILYFFRCHLINSIVLVFISKYSFLEYNLVHS